MRRLVPFTTATRQIEYSFTGPTAPHPPFPPSPCLSSLRWGAPLIGHSSDEYTLPVELAVYGYPEEGPRVAKLLQSGYTALYVRPGTGQFAAPIAPAPPAYGGQSGARPRPILPSNVTSKQIITVPKSQGRTRPSGCLRLICDFTCFGGCFFALRIWPCCRDDLSCLFCSGLGCGV